MSREERPWKYENLELKELQRTQHHDLFNCIGVAGFFFIALIIGAILWLVKVPV